MALGFLYGAGGGGGQPEPESKALIPTMTSNTTPSGVASASTEYSTSYQAWKAFNGVESGDTNRWLAQVASTAWLRYAFVSPVVVKSLRISNANGWGYHIQLQGSNNGTDWVDIGSGFNIAASGVETVSFVGNKTPYIQYRVYLSEGASGGAYALWSLQLYGYDPSWTPAKFPIIYDHGSWSVAYDNSARTWGGYTSNPFVISSDCVYNSSGTACISTTNAIDLSNYTTLHVLIKRTNANNYSDGICISTTKSVDNQVANVIFANLVANTPVEVTLDITSLSSGYIVLHCDTVGWYAYKIWLT